MTAEWANETWKHYFENPPIGGAMSDRPIKIAVYLGDEEIWSVKAPPSYAMNRLSAAGTGHQGVMNLVPGLARAVRDAEIISEGSDPERMSEKAIRLAAEAREREQEHTRAQS